MHLGTHAPIVFRALEIGLIKQQFTFIADFAVRSQCIKLVVGKLWSISYWAAQLTVVGRMVCESCNPAPVAWTKTG